jgi:hypothetical protein
LMTQLAPRSSVLAPGVVSPENCVGYSGSKEEPLVFALRSPTYIDDLHVVGDGYDGDLTTDSDGNNLWLDTCDSNGVVASNKYFYDANFYVGTNANFNEATECTVGDLGAENLLKLADITDNPTQVSKMLKVGGSVSCGNQIEPMSYVFLKLPKQDFNVCSVGIFTCTCDKDYAWRN